ncbi:MAG: carboxymuconolactone decarboxylase family protein [Phenylobacterium sp.]|nr:carboxymuconolactone decarboxylase family protein [Phenylobacterium sp.]
MIRSILAALAVASMAMPAAAQAPTPRVAPEDMRWVAPALADYTDEVLFGQVWRGPELSPRDRSIVTLSALVAGGNTAQMTSHLNRALDNGVKPLEIGGLITHLAFYSGWPKSVSALAVTRQVLEARGVTTGEMQAGSAQPGEADRLRILRKGSGPVTPGSAANFTGAVKVSAPFQGIGGSRIGGATVAFAAGARSAWHRHAVGQTLVVTDGCGLVQREGGPIQRVCTGDVIVTAPGEKHWHGATATSAMTHVALSEGGVEWLEPVSDAQYAAGPR